MNILVPLVLLCALPAVAQETAASGNSGPRYAVVPFAALTGDVPPRAGQKAAGMLSTELKNSDTARLAELKRPAQPAGEPAAEPLARSRALVEEAKAARQARKFRVAEEKLKAALEGYRAHAGGVTEPGEVQDAYALLAAVQFLTGRDEEGQKTLNTAVGLSPKRELPLAGTSRLFARVVEDTRKAVLAGPKGALVVESQPHGAQVWVDGVLLGRTPLQVKDVPPGPHLWRVALPTGTSAGGVAEVTSGKTVKVSGKSDGSDAESRLLTALGQNKLDETALTAARELGRSAEADVLLFGALTKEGKGLSLEPFALQVGSGELRRLPRRNFDTELLNAGMELFNLVGELAKGGTAGEVVKPPVAVSRTGALPTATVAEARYGVALRTAEDLVAAEPTTEEQPAPAATEDKKRAPLDPNKKRTPLKKP